MSIDELVKKHTCHDGLNITPAYYLRNALTEQAEMRAIELRAYEATVENLEQRIRQMEAERVTEDLPYWPPCNPGCDPEFNGCRSKGCATLCDPARKAMLAAAPAQEKM